LIKHYTRKCRTFVHTLRHLHAIQIVDRAKQLVRHSRKRAIAYAVRPPRGPWRRPLQKPISLLGPARFRFLNEVHALRSAKSWNDPGLARLWLYHLHYFDDLNAVDSAKRRAWHSALIERWIAENPFGLGAGWEPYPLSRRIVNWIKWLQDGSPAAPNVLESLAQQADCLSHSIEYRLLGNHLLANAVALIHAGLFFEGNAAQRWYAKGMRILAAQLPEQILADGGHFERSPMYHGIVLEDLLDVLNIMGRYGEAPPQQLKTSIEKMLDWLAVMHHPDGRIPFFNDATFNVAVKPSELDAYARHWGLTARANASTPVTWLRESGYVRVARGPVVAFFGVAPVEPSYMPGHAHADTLSFECSLDGQRSIVNSGISTYERGPERLRQRGSSAHNTLVINDENSSEVWSAFRVARRARVSATRVTERADAVEVAAAHDGYRRLPGRPVHWRRWRVSATGIVIDDSITGAGEHEIMLHFHFHPAVKLQQLSANRFVARRRRARCGLQIALDPKSWSNILQTTYHPGFGKSEPMLKIVSAWYGPLPAKFCTEIELVREVVGDR
jgi:uncharacterized heparinase superfamily protein